MNTHTDKTTKSNAVANGVAVQQGAEHEGTFQLEDNRHEAIAQRKIQEAASNSPQVNQFKTVKALANNSPQVKQLRAVQAMANDSTYNPNQFKAINEEETIQGKFKPVQRKSQAPADPVENKTGLPDHLKSGVENLSGYSLDDVKVHYNSDKPAQLNALAYAQGTDIHVASGQDRHLPHEAWHVVQQKQGRVQPTVQVKREISNAGAGSGKQVVQCVLVNITGKRLTGGEIEDYLTRYPDQAEEIMDAENSIETFSVRSLRHSLTIEPYRIPTRPFHYAIPEGFTTTSPANHTNSQAASSIGMPISVERTDFASDFSQQLLASSNGPQYEGASMIAGGMGLKDAGLDRTHHLADSSIRALVTWLHRNRRWQGFGLGWVIEWFRALTGGQNIEAILNLMGSQEAPPTTADLNNVVDMLSNNTHQVGFGSSQINQKVVGPFFDASKTSGGFVSPLAASIQIATEGLRNVGVPEELLQAVLAEVVNEETGEKQTSMTFKMPPPKDPPFGGKPPFGGSGFGGGGMGFGGGGMGFGFGGVTFK
jgi:hypothetical protein